MLRPAGSVGSGFAGRPGPPARRRCASAPSTTCPFDPAPATTGARALGAARAGRPGAVHRVDARQRAAPSRLPRSARRRRAAGGSSRARARPTGSSDRRPGRPATEARAGEPSRRRREGARSDRTAPDARRSAPPAWPGLPAGYAEVVAATRTPRGARTRRRAAAARRRQARRQQPAQGVLARAPHHEGRPAAPLRAGLARAAARRRRSPAHHEALPERRHGQELLPAARARRSAERGARGVASRATRTCRRDSIGGSLPTLLYRAQLASISQDPWFSRVQSPQVADYVALDLDPMPGVPFAQVRDVARFVGDELGRHRGARVPQDVGLVGAAHLRPARRRHQLRGRAAVLPHHRDARRDAPREDRHRRAQGRGARPDGLRRLPAEHPRASRWRRPTACARTSSPACPLPLAWEELDGRHPPGGRHAAQRAWRASARSATCGRRCERAPASTCARRSTAWPDGTRPGCSARAWPALPLRSSCRILAVRNRRGGRDESQELSRSRGTRWCGCRRRHAVWPGAPAAPAARPGRSTWTRRRSTTCSAGWPLAT